MRLVGDSIDELRVERDEAAFLDQQQAKRTPSKLAKEDQLTSGDWIVVAAPHTPWYGFKGQVLQIMKERGETRVKVKVQGTGATVVLDKTELGKSSPPPKVEIENPLRPSRKPQ